MKNTINQGQHNLYLNISIKLIASITIKLDH
jgi:hypothetical protein